MKLTYTAVFEQEKGGGWAAYVPDLPTIIASAATREEAETLVREAIEIYSELQLEKGEPMPRPGFQTAQFDVLVAA